MSASRIGRYEILRPLGKGAMGIVFLARDPQIEREVALKTVRFDQPGPHPPKIEEAKARFLKEAKISGRLQHPHIVTVYDVGEDQGTLYLAMEYVAGGSLAQRLVEPVPLDLSDRIRIVVEVAEALGHAHERGVIHRDIKPANILLTETLSAKVTDFGIGKLLSGDTDLTSTGQMVGSPAYMSPEQIRGEKLDARSDIFSLGVVLYQTLTLRKPFPADTLTTLVYQILHEEPSDPAAVREDLPQELTAIVRRCLAKSRDERYRDAMEVAAELGELIGRTPTMATASLSESKVRRATQAASQMAAAKLSAPPSSEVPTVAAPLPGLPPRPASTAAAPSAAAPPEKKRSAGTRAAVGALFVFLAAAAVLLARRAPWLTAAGGAAPTPAPKPVPTVPLVAPEPTPTPEAGIAVIEQPTPVPTATPRPRPTPTATPTPAPTPTPTPTPPLADVSYSVRRSVTLNLSPDQARVWVDGRFVGISDDWDDSGGGSELTWVTPGKHRLRAAYPGRRDLNIEVTVTPGAREESAEIEQKLEKGSPSGATGPEGTLPRPSYRTVGPVRFEVEPPDAVVNVNGHDYGPASKLKETVFEDMAVYHVTLSAPEHDSRAFRVLVSPSAGTPRAVIKERLKKSK